MKMSKTMELAWAKKVARHYYEVFFEPSVFEKMKGKVYTAGQRKVDTPESIFIKLNKKKK